MARYNDRNKDRYGRESDYGSDRENFRRNRGNTGRNRGGSFNNDILDRNYGFEDEGYFGGGSGEGYGRGYLGGSTDFGTGGTGSYGNQRSSGSNYGTEDYGSGYGGSTGNFGGGRGSGGGSYGQGRSGSGSTDYGRNYESNRGSNFGGGRNNESDRSYGNTAGRFNSEYDNDRDYNYGNEGYYGGTSAGYGSTYGENYGGGSSTTGGNYGGGGGSYYRQGSEGESNRDYDYDRNRGYGGGRGGERGWFEKAADQVASWFEGDESGRSEGYRGRGTRNYQRSDSRISEDVNDRLTDDYYLDASDIEVSVENGEITLTGTVNSRNAKRYAEDLAESVSGVKHVQNNLRVRESSASGYNSDTTASTSLTGTGANTTTGSTEMTGTTGTTDTSTTTGRSSGRSKSAGGTS